MRLIRSVVNEMNGMPFTRISEEQLSLLDRSRK